VKVLTKPATAYVHLEQTHMAQGLHLTKKKKKITIIKNIFVKKIFIILPKLPCFEQMSQQISI
jgi:hypothetical protein